MPKDSRKESHKKKFYNKSPQPQQQQQQQQHQKENSETISRPTPHDPINNFLSQHQNELNSLKDQVFNLKSSYEELYNEYQHAKAFFSELDGFLAEKTKNTDEIVENFDKLESEKMELIITVNNKIETIDKLERQFAEVIDKLTKELNEEKEKNAKIIEIEEAKRDACLKEMEAKFENIIAESDKKLQELQEKNDELENKLKEMINEVDENKAKNEILLTKQTKKTQKKIKIINELKAKISKLETEKKEKEQELETQSLKMRDLQNVLDRQYQRVEPISTAQESQQQINVEHQFSDVLQPTNAIVAQPNTQQAHQISPIIPLISNQIIPIQASHNSQPPLFDNSDSDIEENEENRNPASSNGDVLRISAINRSVVIPEEVKVHLRRRQSSGSDSDIGFKPYTNFPKRRRN